MLSGRRRHRRASPGRSSNGGASRRRSTALDDLLDELERQREERTLRPAAHRGLDAAAHATSGWRARSRRPAAARTMPGGPEPIGTGPDGRLARRPRPLEDRRHAVVRARADRCWRWPISTWSFDQLTQRANRANVSFYPIDPRGLVVVRRADRPGPAAGPGRRRADPAAAPGRPARAGRRDRRHGGAQHQHRQGAAAAAHRRRRLLPARLRLDQPEARRPLPAADRAREAARASTVRARPGYLAPTAAEVSAVAP